MRDPKPPEEKSGSCLGGVRYLYGKSLVVVLEKRSLASYAWEEEVSRENIFFRRSTLAMP